MDDEYIEDTDWARDVFDASRGEAEPVWGADVAAITRAGDRRRRLRTVRNGGGMLGVVAVTVAVAVTLGAGTTDYGSKPGPAGGWDKRRLQDVFQYAAVQGGGGGTGDVDFFHHVPATAATDVAALIGNLDPARAHLKGAPAGPARGRPRIVSATDSGLKGASIFFMGSSWTADGSYPPGADAQPHQGARVEYNFYRDVNELRPHVPGSDDARLTPMPCGLSVDMTLQMRAPDKVVPKWSECRYTVLADGSKVGTTSAALGAGMETVAVRIFADGNVVSVLGWDFPQESVDGTAPPGTVVKPSPWSESNLRAALSDPEVGPVFPPMPAPNADGRMLAPTDLGPDWAFDLGMQSSTGEFVMDNGCSPDHSVFGLAPGRGIQYSGTLPGGTAATVFEGEYRLPSGSGAATMQDARKYAQGGCDPQPGVVFSKDTMSALPSGIGEDAFVELQPQQAMARVYVRFGDTVLEATVTRSDTKPLDLTSAAGTAWLERVARQMAAHWTHP
ncbi:hypothetical protein [Catenulispora subtropica]|uniref:Uncharacterized protein n=1 Tax=Catenulispora subtropica TaxID=450798 RepID=A0ABP5BU61_9ACTN